jgi:hypothetical protein
MPANCKILLRHHVLKDDRTASYDTKAKQICILTISRNNLKELPSQHVGSGETKKEAENAAAYHALTVLNGEALRVPEANWKQAKPIDTISVGFKRAAEDTHDSGRPIKHMRLSPVTLSSP